jgi:type II secretory pathway component GspD/PulD (secretin)
MRTRPSSLALVAVCAGFAALGGALRAQPEAAAAAPATTPAAPTVPPPVVTPAPDAATPATPAAPDAAAAKAAADAAVPAKADDAHGTVAKTKDSTGRDTLSVDFPDEDVRNILRNVADLFELNIIMPETLQGKTTIKLRDVTWRQIFQNVLDPVGYTYVEDGNIIKIVSKDTLNEEPVTTDVFVINYARAADILPTINSLVDSTKGKIVVDSRSNSLVITERPTRLNRIRPIIEQLDRATDQVMIESKFVEVTDTDVKNIGINWASLQNYGIGVGNLHQSFDRSRGNTLDSSRNQNDSTRFNDVNSATKSNNVTTNNTQNNGSTTSNTITSTNGTPSSISSTGSTGGLTNGTTTTGVNGTSDVGTTTADNLLSSLNNIAYTGGTNRMATALFSADDFKVVLSALQTQGDVKIVSNPTIVTLNNTEATINVGESDPIPNYAFNQQTGSFEVNGFTYKDIGIILKVTPQVNARGFIKLTLAPEVSQKNGVSRFGVAEIPIIATRKAVTQVSLKDGFTMGIGGLLSTQSTTGQTKVPVLGSVPVLGRLFRSDNKNLQTTNLIIFITAKTVSADGAPVEQVFESSRVRQLGMRREDMPGYRDGSTPYVTDPVPPTTKHK